MNKILWKLISTLFVIVLLSGLSGKPVAAALDITVGYYDYDDYLTVDTEGHITGYAGEILDMLVEQNTHWHFVPVKFNRGEFLVNMRKGFAVISMQSPFAQNNPSFLVYSEKPVAIEKGIFYAGLNQEINYEDFEIFDGMRVGSITGDMQNNLFTAYQKEHGFSVDYVMFNSLGEIKQALENREIDGLIYGSIVEQADLKIIARYAETPLHVAGNQWGADFIEFFNRVLRGVYAENPDFLDDMYAKYYGGALKAVQARTVEEELAFIEAEKKKEEEERLALMQKTAQDDLKIITGLVPEKTEHISMQETPTGPAPDHGEEQGGGDKPSTQAGFIAGIAMLTILIVGATLKKNMGLTERGPRGSNSGIAIAETILPEKTDKIMNTGVAVTEDKAIIENEEVTTQSEAIKMDRLTQREQDAMNTGAPFTGPSTILDVAAEQDESRHIPIDVKADPLSRWFYAMEGIEPGSMANAEAPEYSDDQIRGEIYLSGLTFSLQPRYSVIQNKLVGAEVSISCRHPIRDRVYPEELVRSLTQKAKLHILDRYIFESLCLCKPQEKLDNGEDFEIVIPIFTESVIRADFSRWYIDAAKNYGISPAYFRLDLIYRWQSDQDQQVYQSLKELSDAGFRVAIKDAGSANYPLRLLSEVDIEAIVAAEQLVVDALNDGKKKKLLAALKSVCMHMGFRFEADRIDSREKFQLMADIGCEVFQGNFLTRDIPFEQFWDYKRRLDIRTA